MMGKSFFNMGIPALILAVFIIACSDDSGSNTESINEIDSIASSLSSSSDEVQLFCDSVGTCYKSPLETCGQRPSSSDCYASCQVFNNSGKNFIGMKSSGMYEKCKQACIDFKDSLDTNSYCRSMIRYESDLMTTICDSKTNFCSYDFEIEPCAGKDCMTDTRDGQVYRITTIGKQTWMAQNLNYRGYIVSTAIMDSLSFCYMDSCAKYGRYYTWAAAMDSSALFSTSGKNCGSDSHYANCSPKYPVQGICPFGWHLPDTTEWELLLATVGGKDIAGGKLKATTGWGEVGTTGWGDTGKINTNSVNFFVFPTGKIEFVGQNKPLVGPYNIEYEELFGRGAYFWTSTHGTPSTVYIDYDFSFAYTYDFGYSSNFVDKQVASGALAARSVRCVKD
jgi:uncharacterized protein (TIGR02145 family)